MHRRYRRRIGRIDHYRNKCSAERPKDGISGLLHKGMNPSLDAVDADIAKFVMDNGGATAGIRITGHSLGGGMAQIMGAYLKNAAQMSANVSSTTAAIRAIRSLLPRSIHLGKIQHPAVRIPDDPIAMLPPDDGYPTNHGPRAYNVPASAASAPQFYPVFSMGRISSKSIRAPKAL